MVNKIKCFRRQPIPTNPEGISSAALFVKSREMSVVVMFQLSGTLQLIIRGWQPCQSNNIDSITSLQFPFRFPGHESPSEVDVILPLVKHLWSSAPTPVFMTLETTRPNLWPTWYHHHLAWRVRFWNSQAFMSSFYDVIKLPLTLKLWKNICLRDFHFGYMTSATFDTCSLVVYFSVDFKYI